MRLLDQTDPWLRFHVSSSCPLAQRAKVKRSRWMQQHSRFVSQLRNVKLGEPTFFIMGCKQNCLTFVLKETLSQSYKIIIQVSLKWNVQSQRTVSAFVYKRNTNGTQLWRTTQTYQLWNFAYLLGFPAFLICKIIVFVIYLSKHEIQ